MRLKYELSFSVVCVLLAAACADGPTGGSDGSGAQERSAASQGASGAASGAVSTSSTAASLATGPEIDGCEILPADNPWNTRVDGYPVHPKSDTYIAHMAPHTSLHADWGSWSNDHYGIPWQTVAGGQATAPMTFDASDESDPGPYPFPPGARVEGGAGSGGDMHVVVLDRATCTLYETWNSSYVGPGWSCGSGAVFPLETNGLRPDGWTSADAAGLPVFPGLVKLSEIKAGVIRHALRFTVDRTQQGYIHPATHAAGLSNRDFPPMGLRVRLKASFDLSPFSGPALVILTAMKDYGMLLADNGDNWFVTGDSDDAWAPLMDDISDAMQRVKGDDFEAVDTGPISTAGL